MFNQFTPAEVVSAVGRTTMDAARSSNTDDKFAQGQLMSASSSCRHLAVELAAYPPVLRAFADDVAAVAAPLFPRGSAEAGLVDRLRTASDFVSVGEIVGQLLDVVRTRTDPASLSARTSIRRSLADLTESEVGLLSQAIEPNRPGVESARAGKAS